MRTVGALAFVLLFPAVAGLAQPRPIPGPSQECRQAVALVERASGLPPRLMAAIARVESGRSDGQGGVHPWPWTINVEGVDHIYDTKQAAVASVRAFQANGVRSIDVGCMQVNLMYHPGAFASLEEAFDPLANARYAAKFLGQLYAQTHDWAKATAMYHSATPALGNEYQRKVYAALPDEERRALTPVAARPGNVWSQNVWNTGAAPAISRPPISRPPGGGFMLSNRSDAARVIPTAAGAPTRGLDAYRARPVAVTTRPPPPARS